MTLPINEATKLNKVWAITIQLLIERGVINSPRSFDQLGNIQEIHVQGADQRTAYWKGGILPINEIGGTMNLEFANNQVYFFAGETVRDGKKLEQAFRKIAYDFGRVFGNHLIKYDTTPAKSARFGYKLSEEMQEANDYEKAKLLAQAAEHLIHIHEILPLV